MPFAVGLVAERPLGGSGTDPPGGGVTSPLATDVALVEPPRLNAMTENRIVELRSPALKGSTVPVAPLIAAQFAPVPSQRSHWYEYLIPDPLHVPTLPVSVPPTSGVPLTVGGAVFRGDDPHGLDFAAALPLPKRPKSPAATTAVPSQILRRTTHDVSARADGGCFPRWRASSPALQRKRVPADT
jgi:hypothetical protein